MLREYGSGDDGNAPSVEMTASKVGIGKLAIKPVPAIGVQGPVGPRGGDGGPNEGGKGGEGGLPPLPVSNAAFLAAVMGEVEGGAKAAVCSKAGDPGTGAWDAEAAGDVDRQCPPTRNNYFNCSTFTVEADGTVQAKKHRVSAYHVLVLDDVGTKIDRSNLNDFAPTWEIETSPGNSQIGIRLTTPIDDQAAVKVLQDAVIAAGLSDPGAGGAARWSRLPDAINGKAKYRDADGQPFHCRLIVWNPEVSYTAAELAAALCFSLTPVVTRAAGSATVKPMRRVEGSSREDDVYTPKAVENPVVTALKSRDLYKRLIAPGKHDITCPWVDEHTDGVDGGTAYFEPDRDFPIGGFCCQHSHGGKYRINALLDYLGVQPQEARDKPVVRLVPGELNRIVRTAELVLAGLGAFYESGGVILAVRTDRHTGDISTEMVSEAALATALAEAAVWLKFDAQRSVWVRTDAPPRIVQLLLRAQAYEHLPYLTGLSRQPYLRETDGQLVLVPGYDVVSGRYAAFDPAKFALPEPTEAAARAALNELDDLLCEFKFATPADRSATLCAMLTGAVRSSLPVAPAFNITASTPGSGKSYLSSAIVPFTGPGVAAKVSYPTTADEATKSMLSLLLQAPSAVVFDDMQSPWLAFGAINRMLTSETMTDRVLGVSRTVTVPTRSLFIGTGNNVGPVQDMMRRVITIRLAPRTATPATLSYVGRPAEKVLKQREHFVGLALTIIRAYRAAGSPRADVCSIASYNGLWDELCRQPLMWLGMTDPATSLIEQVSHDPDQADLANLLRVWHDTFGEASKTLRQVLELAADHPLLQEALLDLPITNGEIINRSKLGWYLKRHEGRIADGLAIRKGTSTERNSWQVVAIGAGQDAP